MIDTIDKPDVVSDSLDELVRPWVSVMDEMPPSDTTVETKGGGCPDDEIIMDYFHSTIGDWMNCPGDPTHWRMPNRGMHGNFPHTP